MLAFILIALTSSVNGAGPNDGVGTELANKTAATCGTQIGNVTKC